MSQSNESKKSLGRYGAMLVALLVLGDLGAWAVHVVWRGSAMDRLQPVVEQIDALEAQIQEDDSWIDTNAGIMQEYAQTDRFAARVASRGRKVTTHDVLVESYNEQLELIFKRFYLAPLPTPETPLRSKISP